MPPGGSNAPGLTASGMSTPLVALHGGAQGGVVELVEYNRDSTVHITHRVPISISETQLTLWRSRAFRLSPYADGALRGCSSE